MVAEARTDCDTTGVGCDEHMDEEDEEEEEEEEEDEEDM